LNKNGSHRLLCLHACHQRETLLGRD
jgi:hypothetical protein